VHSHLQQYESPYAGKSKKETGTRKADHPKLEKLHEW